MSHILGLAPMDGVTNYIYRRLVQEIFDRYGDKKNFQLRKWTEFMSSNGYMTNPSRVIDHIVTSEDERFLTAQIYGRDLEMLLHTAKDIESKYPYFRGIELNIGCPSPKIFDGGAGSGMLQNKKETLSYVKALSESISLPFSIKTRSGFSKDDRKEQFKFIIEMSQYCETISIHGRPRNQVHKGPVDREFIYELKKEIGNKCKVIGNGGITSYDDPLVEQGIKYNLDGFLLGQSAMANPRVFVSHQPSQEEIFALSVRHILFSGAYEIYLKDIQSYHNEENEHILINRQYLHLKKLQDKNNEKQQLPTIQPHDYKIHFPNYHTLDEISTLIHRAFLQKEEIIQWNNTNYNVRELHSANSLRKYIFGYIKGLANTKDLKQKIIHTTSLGELYRTIADFSY